jgi:hypothetical protein
MLVADRRRLDIREPYGHGLIWAPIKPTLCP